MNFSVLNSMLETVARCPDCGASVELIDQHKFHMGFSHKLNMVCTDCH